MSDPANALILGPETLMWKYFGDSRVLYLLPSTTTVQVAHPGIGAGVDQHSAYKEDPWGRLDRSLGLLWPVLYNTPEGVLDYGRKLREMHRPIKGTGFDGKAYHALNPELYTWVHITTYYGMIALAEFNGDTLTEAQKEQLYDEWLQFGRQMGIRDEHMPASTDAYWAYVEDMIASKLCVNPSTEYVMHKSYYTGREKRPGSTMPDWQWRLIARIQGEIIWNLKFGFFPPSYRRKFNLKWEQSDQRRFDRISWFMQKLWPLLPERSRWVPQAWNVIEDARLHPERYRPTLWQQDSEAQRIAS